MSLSVANQLQLNLFCESLPYKPYCTDDLGFGLQILPKKLALKKKYIQANPPVLINFFLFDIDRPEAALAWFDAGLPRPYWVAINPKNGHAHICYALETPVCTSDIASIKPMKYAAAIQAAYAKALGSDTGYSRLITKNPIHPDWIAYQWTDTAYPLGYLADFVDLTQCLTQKEREQGLGRNVTIFDSVRFWAYKHVREYETRVTWEKAVKTQVEVINSTFPECLPANETKSIAKSIAKWVWERFDVEASDARFSEKQAVRGRKGGTAKGMANSEKRAMTIELAAQGLSLRKIAEQVGASKSSISNWVSK